MFRRENSGDIYFDKKEELEVDAALKMIKEINVSHSGVESIDTMIKLNVDPTKGD